MPVEKDSSGSAVRASRMASIHRIWHGSPSGRRFLMLIQKCRKENWCVGWKVKSKTVRRRCGSERVVMTPAAREFIAPLTFQALSGHPVHTELLDEAAEAADPVHGGQPRRFLTLTLVPAFRFVRPSITSSTQGRKT